MKSLIQTTTKHIPTGQLSISKPKSGTCKFIWCAKQKETKRKKASRPSAARPQAFFCEASKSKSVQNHKIRKTRKPEIARNEKFNTNNDKQSFYKSNLYE